MESDEKLIETKDDEDKDELLGPLVSHVVKIRETIVRVIVDIRLSGIFSTVITRVAKVTVLFPYLHHHAVGAVRTFLKKQKFTTKKLISVIYLKDTWH